MLPEKFGHYRVGKLLGEGGMGAVHLAVDTRIDFRVALKVPRPELAADPAIREQFLREAGNGLRLIHRSICRVLDFGEVDGVPYLAMPYLARGPVRPSARSEPDQVLDLVHTVALALVEAHVNSVIHCDLKPANILLNDDGQPVLSDFGLAVRLNTADAQLPGNGQLVGTLGYMAPEQVRPEIAPLGPACDVWALGVILYELLTGEPPFPGPDLPDFLRQILGDVPAPPSQRRPGLPAEFDAICARAMAKKPQDRFASMSEFADELAQLFERGSASRPAPRLVNRDAIRFMFAPYGTVAPDPCAGQDRLFLDIGSGVRPGCVDHHHLTAAGMSSAFMLLQRPRFLDGALSANRRPETPFTIILHERPDFDCVASAYVAFTYLTTGAFPDDIETLVSYADEIDRGGPGLSQDQPFTLYAAYLRLVDRSLRQTWKFEQDGWTFCVRQGLGLVKQVLRKRKELDCPLPDVDAFADPRLFDDTDRDFVTSDLERYRRKLADPKCAARRAILRLPAQFGGTRKVEALLVRHVQDPDDPTRCVYFKEWARTDRHLCPVSGAGAPPGSSGFVATSVIMESANGSKRRAIISVRPDAGVSLRGFGAVLDEAESAARVERWGEDDRRRDPITGEPRKPREGYSNADPWYDGKSHGYTIVDAPSSGTLLEPAAIEDLFLRFGQGAATPLAP